MLIKIKTRTLKTTNFSSTVKVYMKKMNLKSKDIFFNGNLQISDKIYIKLNPKILMKIKMTIKVWMMKLFKIRLKTKKKISRLELIMLKIFFILIINKESLKIIPIKRNLVDWRARVFQWNLIWKYCSL